jgi:predicted small lipoprotein YifL
MYWQGSGCAANGEDMARIARNLVLALSVALVLAACGRRSDLQKPLPPPDVPKDASGKSADPNRPFILDPLLR